MSIRVRFVPRPGATREDDGWLVTFVAGSAVAALAPSAGVLIAGRVIHVLGDA